MAITVTATPTGAKGAILRVLVLTGAVESGGASDGPGGNTGGSVSLTPNHTNSFIAWANNNEGNNGAFTSISNNTILDNIAGTNGTRMATGYYTGTVTGGTPVTVGATGAGSPTTTSTYEVPASGGSTPAIDASSPAVADETSGSAALTTASFSPPSSVLCAILTASNFPSGWTISNTGSGVGTWTKRIDNGDGQQIWTATFSGGATDTIAGAANAVATGRAAGATTKPVSAAQPAVAAGAAAGATTKPAAASRPAVAAITASATVGLPAITASGASAAVAVGRAAGQSTKPASGHPQAAATGRAQAASTKPISGTTRPAVAAITASASVNFGQPLVVQQVSGSSTSDYGLSSVPISTTAGNGIVVFAGWDLHNAPTTAPVPVVYVADSAGNYWYHLGTSSVGGYGSRSAIWCCPNAFATEWVSVSLTAFASSLAYLVVEIENFPDFADLDVEADSFVNAGIPSQQAFTKAGSGKWTAPGGVTSVNAQCWAAGGGGAGGAGNGVPVQGGSGGGGGEYAAEATLATTAGHSYAWTVGAAGKGGSGVAGSGRPGQGGNGASTTFAGDAVTVTAHGGQGGQIVSGPPQGGTGGHGSTNTTHHNGGNGGSESSAFHGIAGGSSAGPAAAGNSAGTDDKTAALAVAQGGPGGDGGDSTSPFYGFAPVGSPGGGGGGGGANNKSAGNGGSGTPGQIVLTWTSSSPATLSLAATTVTADLAFTMLAAGSGTATLSAAPASPWVALDTVASGTTDGMTIFPYWQASVSAAAALTPSWTVASSVQLSGVLAAIESSPAAPVQSNANFPVLKVEIAEGFTPGDPTAEPPSWTDITARCMGKDGDSFITVTYGQQYELATPEAGEMVIGVNNLDGAFTPGNQTTPYTVVLGMPVRVSAYWDGVWYQVGFGYVERWPTEWPDLPQWGLSKLTCTDSIAVLNSATMPSALQGDILADGPYLYLPCSEQYLSYINGLTPESGNLESYSVAEAAGLLAANLSRVNQRAGAYCDGITAAADTGSALNLFGDQGTGFGASSISGNVSYSSPATGPGVIYSDPAMPDPTNAVGVSVELWFVYSLAETSGQGLTLFQAFGSPSSFWPTASFTPVLVPPTAFAARILSTSNEIQVELNGTSVNCGAFVPSGSPQQLVLTFPASGVANDLLVYYNGVLLATIALSGGEITSWQACVLGPATYAYSAAPLVQNFTEGHGVIYPYTLSAARVAAHYSTGSAGASGSTISQGAAQILSWGYLGIPRGGPAGFGPAGSQISDGITLGPFYSLDGSSAADALNAAILSDGGMMYAAPSGTLIILPRWALFNEASQATLGDATDGSQVPYLMGQAYDYDNTYVDNIVSVTRNDGPTESITVTVRNAPSQLAYFTRSALQQTISTTSDEDAYTLSNWEGSIYAQPQMRVRQLDVDAASNPSVAFPVVLPMTVSDVLTVDRDPVGGVPISGQYLTQRVSLSIGPSIWRASYQLSPYVIQAAVLTADTSGFNAIGTNALS